MKHYYATERNSEKLDYSVNLNCAFKDPRCSFNKVMILSLDFII